MKELPKTARLSATQKTTPAGFGTATLGRLDSPIAIRELLEVAYDSGIRHFDTARLYGHGTMERQVGEFLGSRRAEVTIATKFGLQPALPALISVVWLGHIKRWVKKVPFLRNRARALAAPASAGQYEVPAARLSLEKSLRELGTDYLDVFFIHEGSPAVAADERLISFLDREKAQGRIRAFGLAAHWNTVDQVPDSALKKFDVVQVAAEVATDRVAHLRQRFPGSIVTHSVFEPLARLKAQLASSTEIRERWTTRLALDLADPATLPRLLWQAALRQNPTGVTLFSTIRPGYLRANLQTMAEPLAEKKLAAFVELAPPA